MDCECGVTSRVQLNCHAGPDDLWNYNACILWLHEVEYLLCKNLKLVQTCMVLFNLKAKAQKGS